MKTDLQKLTYFILFLFASSSGGGVISRGDSENPAKEKLKGEKCQFWDDEQGIPHLRAHDDFVGYACLGYLHGRDRAWQMDFYRKIASGRKAEITGWSAVTSDFFLRLIGLKEKAARLFQELPEADRKIFWNYAYGVNRGMNEAQKSGVYEFKKLGYLPESWNPEDSILLILLQSFDQTKRSFLTQIDEKKRSDTYADAPALYSQDHLPWDTSILKKGEGSRISSPPSSSDLSSALLRNTPFHSPFRGYAEEVEKHLFGSSSSWGGPGSGSNNWVLSPHRSQNGKAWLANDPHLKLGYPPTWYWVHLNTKTGLDVIGATFPGIPTVVSGSNRNVSWGLTNSFLPAARLSLVDDSELKQSHSYRPWIWFRFWKFQVPFFFKTFSKTPADLPILPLPAPRGQQLVLRWTGLDLRPSDVMGLFPLMKARTTEEADRVLSTIGVPSWNFVFADTQGGMGYRSIGRTPRFKEDLPFGIPHESLFNVENSPAFADPLTPEEMPHLLNPPRGFIVTANNRQTASNSIWNFGRAQITSFRAFRIEELLQATSRHTLASLQKIQCDIQAVDARFLLPYLLKTLNQARSTQGALPLSKGVDSALNELKTWDFQAGLRCRACALYRRWVAHILKAEPLNAVSLYRKISGNFDEDFGQVILNAFNGALDDVGFLRAHELPEWGKFHFNYFDHSAGRDLAETEPLSTPGDEHSVSPGSGEWTGKFIIHTEGASQRLIVEMSQPPQVYSVLAGSNLDTEVRNVNDPDSEWQRWLHCQLQKRNFPVDWKTVESQTKIFFF